jgi:hypothetical protein
MPNQTLIAIPLDITNPLATRQFLVKLVEKLDIVFGFRGGNSYVSTSQLVGLAGTVNTEDNTLSGQLTALEAALVAYIDTQIASTATDIALVNTELDALTIVVEDLKSATTIVNTTWTTPTVSATYVQAEAQNVATQLGLAIGKMNTLLATLRATEIIAT